MIEVNSQNKQTNQFYSAELCANFSLTLRHKYDIIITVKDTKTYFKRRLFHMKEKIYNTIISVNTIVLVLAAIFTVVGSPAGSFLFVYTSSIGFIDSMKNKNVHGIIINSTFLAMNLFFVIRFLVNC